MHRLGRRARQRVIFGVLTVAVMSYSLLQSVTVPTLPLLQHEFDTDQATASWVITAQLLAAAVATPIVGRLGDAYGKNRVLVGALACMAIGALIAAAATHIGALIGGRVVQGIGGGIIPLAFGIVRDQFSSHRRAAAISIISSLMAVGFAAGIVVAGPLVAWVGIHGLFVLPAAVATIAAVAAAIVIPPSPTPAEGGVSPWPALLLASWLTAFLLAVSYAPSWGWTSQRVLGLIAASCVIAGAWIVTESRVRVPVIDLAMMRQRAVWSANLVALLVGFSMYASFGFVPQLVQTPSSSGWGLGADVTQAGHVMLAGAAATFVTGLVSARLASRFGAKRLIIAACAVSSLGIVLTVTWHDRLWHVAVSHGITSLGVAVAFALLGVVMVGAVPAHQTGVATGMNANLRTLGGAVGTAVAISIVTASARDDGIPAEHGYVTMFAVLAVVMLLAGGAALLMPSTHPKRKRVGVTAQSSRFSPVQRKHEHILRSGRSEASDVQETIPSNTTPPG